MKLENYLSDIPLTDIAEVKRAKKGEVLPKGTLYVQVSACKKSNYEIWNVTVEDGSLESKYAYLKPKVEWNPVYMQEVLNAHAPKFMERYVGKNINISMDLFKFYKIDYHWERNMQNEIADGLMLLRNAIFETEEKIQNCEKLKEWGLRYMFADIMTSVDA